MILLLARPDKAGSAEEIDTSTFGTDGLLGAYLGASSASQNKVITDNEFGPVEIWENPFTPTEGGIFNVKDSGGFGIYLAIDPNGNGLQFGDTSLGNASLLISGNAAFIETPVVADAFGVSMEIRGIGGGNIISLNFGNSITPGRIEIGDTIGGQIGFFGKTAIGQPLVDVTAAAIHAALVEYGLFASPG